MSKDSFRSNLSLKPKVVRNVPLKEKWKLLSMLKNRRALLHIIVLIFFIQAVVDYLLGPINDNPTQYSNDVTHIMSRSIMTLLSARYQTPAKSATEPTPKLASPSLESSASSIPPIRPRSSPSELRSIPKQMYLLKKHKVVFCYIPKNACSRFKTLLRKEEGFSDWDDKNKIHSENGLRRLASLPLEEAQNILSDPSYFKFVAVRDPISRTLSAYKNKVCSRYEDHRNDFWKKHLKNQCPSIIKAKTMPKTGPMLTFDEFLDCLNAKDSIESNEHWRPQEQLCALNHVQYDYYAHLETLETDVKTLLSKLHWEKDAFIFESANRAPTSRNDTLLSKVQLDKIKRFYRKDFEVLPYNADNKHKTLR